MLAQAIGGSSYPCSSRSGCSVRCMSIFARLRTVPPMPTRCSPLERLDVGRRRASRRPPGELRAAMPLGGSSSRNRSLTRSDPSSNVHGCLKTTIAEPRDLGAAAADVERRPARHREVVDRADEPESGLGVAVDDLERHPELPCALEQDVARRARRGPPTSRPRGSDRRPRLRRRRGSPGAPRACVRSRRRRARRRHELARQPERRARVLDHVEVLTLPQAEDDHPRGVRSDVEHRERPVVVFGGECCDPATTAMLARSESGAQWGRRRVTVDLDTSNARDRP